MPSLGCACSLAQPLLFDHRFFTSSTFLPLIFASTDKRLAEVAQKTHFKCTFAFFFFFFNLLSHRCHNMHWLSGFFFFNYFASCNWHIIYTMWWNLKFCTFQELLMKLVSPFKVSITGSMSMPWWLVMKASTLTLYEDRASPSRSQANNI